MNYDLPVFRPPSEAESLIFQVTLGCSHNRCTFCSMYRSKAFRARPLDEIADEIAAAARRYGDDVRRVFLADGDALCLSSRRLCEILDALNGAFPDLQRIGIYANARDVLRKTDEELRRLRGRRLKMLYMGLESGDDATLTAIDKGASADEIVEAARRAQQAGFSVSVMVLIGIAGRSRSQAHAIASAEAINRMAPTYTALLTYTPTPGSPLGEQHARGQFELPSALESLAEIRTFVQRLRCRTYFTCNHASNYLPLTGKLPGARDDLLALIDMALAGDIPLTPERLRGL